MARVGFMVNWLDGKGFVIRSHYFEVSDYKTAYRKVWRKYHKHSDKPEVNGFYLTEAPASLLRRYFDMGIHAKPRPMVEIESHMYAPKHLLPKK